MRPVQQHQRIISLREGRKVCSGEVASSQGLQRVDINHSLFRRLLRRLRPEILDRGETQVIDRRLAMSFWTI